MATEDLEPLPPTVQELLREDDPFRLVIRAHAGIEQLIAMATQSIGAKMPEELKHLGFIRTLSLAISLGLVPPEAKELIKRSPSYGTSSRTVEGTGRLCQARSRIGVREQSRAP